VPSSTLTLVVLAAGRSVRYGRPKQLDPIGPDGATLVEYALFDALRAGFERFVVVIRPEHEPDFRRLVAPVRTAGAEVQLAHQVDELVRTGHTARRIRPWGTGFALLAAAHHVDGSFAVGNADDFYGAAAFRVLGTALVDRPEAQLVAYALEETLSPEGGVSRGLCEVDPASGLLLGIREGLDLQRIPDGRVRGRDVNGMELVLPGTTPVSMNLWGFHPEVWPLLSRDLDTFLGGGPGADDEFYLSEAVGRWLATDELRCAVLAGAEGWLGVTFPGDRPRVAQALAALVDSGTYPPALWSSSNEGAC